MGGLQYYMVPKKIRELAKCGSWGIHASLLPKYAGGAPLNWAIINGKKNTDSKIMQELKTYGGRYSEQIALSWVIRAYKRIFYGKTVIEDNCYIKPNVIIQKDT